MKIRMIFLSFLSFLLIFPHAIQAQDQKEKEEIKRVQLLIKGGMNISSIAISDKQTDTYGREKPKIGYNFGLVGDIHLKKDFFIQTGLLISAKGSKLREMRLETTTVDLSMNSIYLQIPALFVYKTRMYNAHNAISFEVGPYFAYGIGGKITGPQMIKLDTFGDEGLCKRGDMGLALGVSYEMQHLCFFANWEYGILKIIKKEALEHDANIRNMNFSIGLAYKL